MVQLMKRVKATTPHKIMAVKEAAVSLVFRSKSILTGNAGEGYIDTAIFCVED